jgi:hypothetical protein
MKKSSVFVFGAIMVSYILSADAKAQFTVVVSGGTLEEVTNVATVGEVTNVGSVANATINEGQFSTLSTALANLQTILAGQASPAGVAAAVQQATQGPAQNELQIVEANETQYPTSYTVAGQVGQPDFGYNGSELISLNNKGGGQQLYKPITGLTTSQWAENYTPFTVMEQKTVNAVKIFGQTSAHIEKLRADLLHAIRYFDRAKSMAEIAAANAEFNKIGTGIEWQKYLRTAALQDVQLLQIANENNRLKREQAIAEEKSEDHQKQIGTGKGTGTAIGLLDTAVSLELSSEPPGGVQ